MDIAFAEEEDCAIYRAWVVVTAHDRVHKLHKSESEEQIWNRILMVFEALDGNRIRRSSNDIKMRKNALDKEIDKLEDEERFVRNAFPWWTYEKRVSISVTPTHINKS